MPDVTKVKVYGYSKDLWIQDYDCWVDTIGIIEEPVRPLDKKVLVTLDEIDGERNVCCLVRRSKLELL